MEPDWDRLATNGGFLEALASRNGEGDWTVKGVPRIPRKAEIQSIGGLWGEVVYNHDN